MGRKIRRWHPDIRIVCAAALLAITSWAPARHDPDERIIALSQQIAREPQNAQLYLARGEMHRMVGHCDEARADYERAGRLGGGESVVALARARMELDAGQPEAALRNAEAFLHHEPQSGAALLIKARALARIAGRRAEAEQAYAEAIEHLDAPRPEHYLEHARIQAARGCAGLDEAISSLDAGIEAFGPIVSLQSCAIELERRRGRPDAALERLRAIQEQAHRQERWLRLRGEILEQAGRWDEAAEAYRAAIAAIDALPARHRDRPATRALAAEIIGSLECLEDQLAARPPCERDKEADR